MAYQTILYDVSGRVARLTLNRPERLNSFNAAMHAEVRDALGRVSGDGARVLVLTGAGQRAFAAGADIAELRDQTPERLHADGKFLSWDRIAAVFRREFVAQCNERFNLAQVRVRRRPHLA